MNVETIHWTDLVRALWPIFVLTGGLLVAAILLALTTKFATVVALKGLDVRLTVCEQFVTEQKTAIGILPTRQQLGESISELSERMAGVEATLEGIEGRMGTQNTYLHTLIEQGMRR